MSKTKKSLAYVFGSLFALFVFALVLRDCTKTEKNQTVYVPPIVEKIDTVKESKLDAIKKTLDTVKREYFVFGIQGVQNPKLVYFKESELASQCNSSNISFLKTDVAFALDYIRGYYNCAIKVTSAERLDGCNTEAGGASQSQHREAKAVDFYFVCPLNPSFAETCKKKFKKSIREEGELFQKLLEMGVHGFGVYSGSFHIDVRTDNFNSTSKTGHGYSVWN